MSDASSLRSLLQRTNLTANSIQAGAGAMMKHYDKSPAVAVTEWRNALQQARQDQYLPLLYIANEVLQNSKRNRGNKFLEAFSPTLGQSLLFIAQRSPAPNVEKLRRTVKIWGDRRVFSVRFVNYILKSLEPFREGATNVATTKTEKLTSPPHISSPAAISAASVPEASNDKIKDDLKQETDLDDDVKNDVEDLFGKASNRLLNIELDLDQAAAAASNKKKRRRSDASSSGQGTGSSPTSTTQKPKRRSVLSNSSLMELWNQVSALQMSHDRVTGALKEIDTPDLLGDDAIQQQIKTLAGDELLEAYTKTIQYEADVGKYRKELHDIAQRKRAFEIEALRYLPWLENALNLDEEDLKFCEKYAHQLKLFEHVHKPAKEARDLRLAEENKRRMQEEEMRKKEEEKEERKRFMQHAMAKQTEAQPGMVWNKATGEYQYLNQDECWRD